MAVKEQELAASTNELRPKMNVLLADWAVMYMKLHHFHWYVKGPTFQALHAKFEELYNMAAQNLDKLAERMLAVGMQPASAMKEYLALASIKENNSGESDTQMLQSVIADFGTMVQELKSAVEAADRAKDYSTADLLNEQTEALQKQIWMLNATVGK